MKQLLSPSLVKNSLSSHSWIGLLVGVFMYLICLSGTLVVFYPQFERWEQPQISEDISVSPSQLQAAYDEALKRGTEETEHMFIGLPYKDMPRASVASDHGGWWLNDEAELAEEVNHDWTHDLINLHIGLHLPHTIGTLIVSIFGVMLISLIVSGFLAHPRIFRDAFTLRLKGSKHLEQADIHNRLSVWGAPFHLMIGITGAYFGLATVMSLVLAQAFFDGDTDKIIPSVFGESPVLAQAVDNAQVGSALAQMPELAPDETPFYITVEDVNTPEQFIIVGTQVPERLIYAEQYRFDAQGNYLSKVGFSDGEAGRQTIFSVYRLHFGHFAGVNMQILFAIFGLALTVVSVTGINIWFARRKSRDALNHLWVGCVWGAPLAITITAIAQIAFQLHSPALFWLPLLGFSVLTGFVRNEQKSKAIMLYANAAAIMALLVIHGLRFGDNALSGVSLGINIALLIGAIVMLWMVPRTKNKA